jgi:hypothetical protein
MARRRSSRSRVPLRLTSATPRTGPSIRIFGRLAESATLESAQAELTAFGRRMAVTHATTHAQLLPRVSVYAAPEFGMRQASFVRLSNIIAWLILVAACANVATLLFARTATCEAEIFVRSALGASRARVMMQLYIEAFVLCEAAALVGLVAVRFGLDYAGRSLAAHGVELPFWWQFTIRPATIVYAIILALGGAAMVGLLPAIRATGPRVQTALSRIASGSTSMRPHSPVLCARPSIEHISPRDVDHCRLDAPRRGDLGSSAVFAHVPGGDTSRARNRRPPRHRSQSASRAHGRFRTRGRSDRHRHRAGQRAASAVDDGTRPGRFDGA